MSRRTRNASTNVVANDNASTNVDTPPVVANTNDASTNVDAIVNNNARRALRDTLSPDALRAQIDALLHALRTTTSQSHKKRLRRALRARGHYGGLSHERTTTNIDALTRVDATNVA